MDDAQDMGGLPWSGPVRPEPNEPPFHAEWERRAFALTLAMAMPGGWNIDMSRFARENRLPVRLAHWPFIQVGAFVRAKAFAILGLHERQAELIQMITLTAAQPIKHSGTRDVRIRLVACHYCLSFGQ